MIWSDFTNSEILELDKNTPAIIPIGLVEAHGPHMTLGFDNESVDYFSKKIANRTGAILAPIINYGFADSNKEYPGTIGLKPRTLTLLIKDICEMFCFHGFKNIIILSGHGANKAPCEMAFYEVWEKYKDLKPVYWNWWEAAGLKGIHHADKSETEIAMAIGSTVYITRAKDFVVKKPWHKERSRYEKMPDSGGINGKPTEADIEKGKEMVKIVIDNISKKINDIIKESV